MVPPVMAKFLDRASLQLELGLETGALLFEHELREALRTLLLYKPGQSFGCLELLDKWHQTHMQAMVIDSIIQMSGGRITNK